MLNFLSRGSMKGEKATARTSLMAHLTLVGALRLFGRLLQFVMGIVVIGLYAQDLHKAQKAGKYADSKWVFATFTGSLSAFVALVWMMPKIRSWYFFAIDFIIFIFWTATFGIFAQMYRTEDPEGNAGIQRMKNAVWVDLTNMLMWFISALIGGVTFWRYRMSSTVHTGRAPSHV